MAQPIGPASPIFCRAGEYTTVLFGLLTAGNYLFGSDRKDVSIQWQRFSAGFPFYWAGTIPASSGVASFVFPPWFFSELQFNPSVDVTITRF